eukprot:TRINITY_DN62444_c1_g1_i1.p1 TRINITY_DN62444_c1_g1~~TRINITY_DN62444_c1_g1_i1.p1  ORF type:complete len:316 (+),score=8.26 TRINITY_DN62444_c1_g1_i1:1-948(+)
MKNTENTCWPLLVWGGLQVAVHLYRRWQQKNNESPNFEVSIPFGTNAEQQQGKPVSRVIYCCDAIAWLRAQTSLPHLVTGLPDICELPGALEPKQTFPEYTEWLQATTKLILQKLEPHAIAIFYQTDCKFSADHKHHFQSWFDKSYYIQKAAEAVGVPLLFHKIVLREAPGTPTHGHPAYHHLLGFSKCHVDKHGTGMPDVIPVSGAKLWSRGTPFDIAEAIAKYLKKVCKNHNQEKVLIDLFCGVATVSVAANKFGFKAIGVDWSQRRCKVACSLVPEDWNNQKAGCRRPVHRPPQKQKQKEENTDPDPTDPNT